MLALVIVGMPGSGKDVLVQTAMGLGFRKISMGDVVRHHAALMKLGSGDVSIGGFAGSERDRHGPAVWADRTLAMMPHGDIIIDGSRSLAEIARFRDALGSDLKILAVTAPPDVRFRRMVERGREDDPARREDFERRDTRELSWGLAEAIASADMTLDNSGSIEKFRERCGSVLQSLMVEFPREKYIMNSVVAHRPAENIKEVSEMTRESVQEIKAKDIMTRTLITVEPHEDVSSALGKMQQHEINEVPVVTPKGKILGIVHYEALLKRRSIPMSTKVENVMAFPPRVGEEMSIIEIAETMLSSGYRAVPVTDKDYIVGIITRTDLVSIVPQLRILKEIEVREIMTEAPHFIKEKDTLEQARSIMYRLDVRALPVTNSKGELTGVLGLKDLAKVTARDRKRKTNDFTAGKGNLDMDVQVKSVMRMPPVTIGREAKISEAVKLMRKNAISTIVVTENEMPIGVVTQYDLMELIASFKSEEQVFVQISGLHEAEPEAYDLMYDLIQRSIKRMAKMVTPKVFTVHVTRQDAGNAHQAGNVTVRGRLTTEHELYHSTTNDWDLALALSTLLSQMEKSIRKDNEKRKTASKKK